MECPAPVGVWNLSAGAARQSAGDAARALRGFWAKLAGVLVRVPFAEDLVAASYTVSG